MLWITRRSKDFIKNGLFSGPDQINLYLKHYLEDMGYTVVREDKHITAVNSDEILVVVSTGTRSQDAAANTALTALFVKVLSCIPVRHNYPDKKFRLILAVPESFQVNLQKLIRNNWSPEGWVGIGNQFPYLELWMCGANHTSSCLIQKKWGDWYEQK